MSEQVIGIIGGSGLYELDGLTDVKSVAVTTPFGDPSDEFITGVLDGVSMVFLPRHGKGHRLLPSEVNYRANIYGMKKLGVERIISVSAVGSMKEEIVPGHIVIPDQFIDRTFARGLSPAFLPHSAEPISTTAAPSTMPDELPAVCTWLMRSTCG